MTRRHERRIRRLGVNLIVLLFIPAALWAAAPERDALPQQLARKILADTGVEGGLVVHLGCGDGRLTAAFRAGDQYTVHGLDADEDDVAEARRYIAGEGLYGPVSVERFVGSGLPYANDLVNLVVVSGQPQVTREEITRVLAPGGVAVVLDRQSQDEDRKWTKPWPDTIDQWTHYLHDATGNAVAQDTEVGPPRSIQWVAPPLWLRSHETPSGIEGLVTGGGRLFYFFDEGLIGITDQRLPERWSLVCRDAFNGRLLWKRPVKPWGWPTWARERIEGKDWTTIRGARTVVPEENQRRLVVDGDRVYATLAYRGPLSILNAATGKVQTTVEETAPVSEILASDGMVLVHSQGAEPAARRGAKDANSSLLIAVEGQSGKVVWKKAVRPISRLMLAIEGGRVVFLSAGTLTCLSLDDGETLWQAEGPRGGGRTLIAQHGVVVLYAGSQITAHDGATGRMLWRQDKIPASSGGESPDLFVIDGLVWRGIVPVDQELRRVGKSADAMVVGYDLRTGEEKKRIVVRQLRSPEHHHRCYRNKATTRYIISSMEGAEFLDLIGDDHCQNNWFRGACKDGMVPANGLLYVPADQCFCQPGAKFLGTAAVAGRRPARTASVPDAQRLQKGEAYGHVDGSMGAPAADDWPTFRHDSARHASTPMPVAPQVAESWRTSVGGRLTAPVAAAGRLYVASADAHTVFALDAQAGTILWQYVAGGRIDSPPTICGGLLLFGSADGYAYCLRSQDGALVWRFLAAPSDRRIGCFDQLESVWPVHGSVLVRDGVAYFTAGRSSYLDGGIRVWALDPPTGKVLHKTTITGPFPDVKRGKRDFAFYLTGANSEVLVSEGEHIYMRQKKLTPDLREVDVPVFSSKGAQDVGLHVFSTSGLLDGSWYNRAFWMYSKRWPGFQLANQSSKSGQLLVVDDQNTFAVRVFYRRNVHSPMFFPGKEGYLLFADRNDNEPQLVGEPDWRKPVAWLPQSHIPREGNPGLDNVSRGFGADKGIGYTRAEPPLWTAWIPIRIRAMVKAGDVLFAAGPPDAFDPDDPYASFEGRCGARLAAVSANDGTELAVHRLDVPPVFDGLIAAAGSLYMSLQDGNLICLRPPKP